MVGNLFWSPHGADGSEPEGPRNPTFLQQKPLNETKPIGLKTQDGVPTGSNKAGFTKCDRRLQQGSATQKQTHKHHV